MSTVIIDFPGRTEHNQKILANNFQNLNNKDKIMHNFEETVKQNPTRLKNYK